MNRTIPPQNYYGFAETRSVYLGYDGNPTRKQIDPARSLKIYNHSPDGFNWGYGGSGAAQLALAILITCTDDQKALMVYHQFKWDVIAKLPIDTNFVLPRRDVLKWLDDRFGM